MALCESGMRDIGFRRAFSGDWIKERYGRNRDEGHNYATGRLEELFEAFTRQKEAQENPRAEWKWQHPTVRAEKPLPWHEGDDPDHAKADDRGESWSDTPANAVNAVERKQRRSGGVRAPVVDTGSRTHRMQELAGKLTGKRRRSSA